MDQIVGAIKRVISEPGIAESELQDYNKGEQSFLVEQKANDTRPVTAYSSGPPAVVEMDEAVNVNVGRQTSTSSSLSDINETAEQIHRSGLQMSADSSVSSFRTNRDGSGNWGWYEDFHDHRIPKIVKNHMAAQVIPSSSSEGEFIFNFRPTSFLKVHFTLGYVLGFLSFHEMKFKRPEMFSTVKMRYENYLDKIAGEGSSITIVLDGLNNRQSFMVEFIR